MKDREDIIRFYRENRPDTILIENEDGFFSLPRPGQETCDFCSSTPVVAAFDAEDSTFSITGGPDLGSTGPWAACATCKTLVDNNEGAQLVTRAVTYMSRKVGLPEQALRETLQELHKGFWENRKPK